MPTAFRRLGLAAATLATLGACASRAPERAEPVAPYYATAQPLAGPGLRLWADEVDAPAREAFKRQSRANLTRRWEAAGRPDVLRGEILALSGGGPDGAFAAGILNGWTERGDRPEFEVVTGISVGALIAPFAFAGPEHDDDLRRIFTEFETSDVAVLQLFAVLRGALGVADTQPLRNQIRAFIDDALLDKIREKHRRGDRLLIGTTNIDAGRPVLWDMGAIAETGDRELFMDVMLASASIPGAFPPVGIEVVDGDRRFTEFHVDGGVTHSVFIGPQGAEDLIVQDMPFKIERTVYVIQNNQLFPAFTPVETRLPSIATRSLSTLIRAQSAADIGAIYGVTKAVGGQFRLAFVPPGFDAASATAFDREYMSTLFAHAERLGREGVPWLDRPPALLGREAVLERIGFVDVSESSTAAAAAE
jgi:predicted acylesterase/phospholipase RssA